MSVPTQKLAMESHAPATPVEFGAKRAMKFPNRGRHSILWAGCVFLAALLVQIIGMSRGINLYDECLELFAAVRILHGDVLYRDFWAMYGPAQFYVLAGLFKLFGTSVLVARLYHALAGACVVALLFVVTGNLTSRPVALVVSVWALFWMTGVSNLTYEFPTYPALALTLATVLLLAPLLRDKAGRSAAAWSGILVGCITLFRHDFGFYVFAAELAMIVSRGMTRGKGSPEFKKNALRNTKDSAAYVLGMLLILVPAAIILFAHVPFHDLYFDAIYVPGRIYPRVRSLPFPQWGFVFTSIRKHQWGFVADAIDYFPCMVGLTSVVYLFATRGKWRGEPDGGFARRLHVLLTILLILMTVKGLVRVSPIQLIQAIILACAVFGVLVSKVTINQKVILFLLASCFAVASLPSVIVVGSVLRRGLANIRNAIGSQADNYPGSPGGLLKESCRVPSGLERMRCFYLDPNEVRAIEYVQANTTPADTIYVGAGRHDKLLLNNLAFYFVGERMSGTKWHDLHPGIETTEPIQSEMVADLRRSKTRYVVLDSTFDDVQEHNQSRFSSGVRVLDNYIHQNFTVVATFGPLSILRLNSASGTQQTP